jgi:REP element-mobilizing transposase RayT
MACLITFTCYGTRLHGRESGSVDRHHNIPGLPYLPANPVWLGFNESRMTDEPYGLDVTRRKIVLEALQAGCAHRGWALIAAHVRTTHVHVVVTAEENPDKVMTALKAYASRDLNESGLDRPGRKRWTRHGSTCDLRTPEAVQRAAKYVIEHQGKPMAVYTAPASPEVRLC